MTTMNTIERAMMQADFARKESSDIRRGKSDAQLREKYPALQNAYDQYKTVLKLVRSQENE